MNMWLGMSRAFLLAGLIAGLAVALPDGTEASSFNEIKKLTASDAESNDRFGFDLGISVDTAIVGACCESTAGFEAGAAYVFQRDTGGANNWGEVKKLLASDAQPNDHFGLSAAISADTAIIGAFDFNIDAGAAYVFERDEGGLDNWGEVTKLVASDGQLGDQFGGRSVALTGDTAIVGAHEEDTGASLAGAAYIFERDEGGVDNWGEVTKLVASDPGTFHVFGIGVAVSGETAIVGAPGAGLGGTAYMFSRNQGGPDNWGEVKKLVVADPESNDGFGEIVAISGDIVVVGSRGDDPGGAAYIFYRNQGGPDNWGEVKKLTASDTAVGDAFGSVAISGDNVVVGANSETAGGTNAGAAYFFQRDEGGVDNWGEVTKLVASDAAAFSNFGRRMTISGNTAAAAAAFEDTEATNAGAAYVFELLVPKPTPPPPAVGGIALDAELRSLPLETAEAGSAPWGVAIVVMTMCIVAVGGASWYTRRRAT